MTQMRCPDMLMLLVLDVGNTNTVLGVFAELR